MDDIQVRDEAEARRLIEAATATIPYGADLLGGVRRRQATRKRRRRIALAAGSGLSAVAVAAGTMLSVAAAGAPSAYAAATAAVTRMSATSYHTSQTHRNARGVLWHGAGDFDPARRAGKMILTYAPPNQGSGLEVRFLGDTLYQSDNYGQPPDWIKYWLKHAPRTDDRAAMLARLDARISGSIPPDPGDMLALVRSATTVHDDGPTSGPGWKGTRFSFRATISKGQQQPPFRLVAMTGTIDVDQQGRVRHLTVTREYQPVQLGHGKHTLAQRITDDISFSDFGEPVSVSAPPASEIFGPELTLTEP